MISVAWFFPVTANRLRERLDISRVLVIVIDKMHRRYVASGRQRLCQVMIFGTGLLAIVGIKLPGLEFKNQRVEAAFRKELVYGEDDTSRAQPPTLKELFADVR